MGLMMMSTNIWTPSIESTMLTHQHVNWRVGGKRTWVFSQRMWKPASLMINTKASRTTSWEVVLSPPWAQQRKWIPIRFKSWPQMQCDKQRLRGKGGPTKCTMQWTKLLKSIKKGIIEWTNNHTPTLGLAQDLTHAWCESKGKSKMMLEN
jgi:hypothetical protein